MSLPPISTICLITAHGFFFLKGKKGQKIRYVHVYLGLVNDETLILLFKNVHRLSDDTTVGFGFIFKHTKGGPSATTGGKISMRLLSHLACFPKSQHTFYMHVDRKRTLN